MCKIYRRLCIYIGYSNYNYEYCEEERRSTYGYLFLYDDILIMWMNKKQNIISKSSTKV